jgi:hypothetical protein
VFCLVFLVLIRQKIMRSQLPPNLSRYSCVVVLVFLLWFSPNLSCLQNNPLENNVEQFPPNLSCLQNNPPENNVEDLAGTRFKLFFSGLFWDRFLLDLRNFFGTRFRYKLMYYYFYHRSDLRKIILFLREIECIEFECNKFVLVLVQIDLILLNIQFVLVQLKLKLIQIRHFNLN